MFFPTVFYEYYWFIMHIIILLTEYRQSLFMMDTSIGKTWVCSWPLHSWQWLFNSSQARGPKTCSVLGSTDANCVLHLWEVFNILSWMHTAFSPWSQLYTECYIMWLYMHQVKDGEPSWVLDLCSWALVTMQGPFHHPVAAVIGIKIPAQWIHLIVQKIDNMNLWNRI